MSLWAQPSPTAEQQKALKESLRSNNGNAYGKDNSPGLGQVRMRQSGQGHIRSLFAPAGTYFEIKTKTPGDSVSSVKRFLLQEHPGVFGLTSPGVDFKIHRQKEKGDQQWVRLQQTYQSLPVFSAEVNVQLQAADSGIEFVLSDVLSDTDSLDNGTVSLEAKLTSEEAGIYAVALMNREYPGHTLAAEPAELMIYAPSVIGAEGSVALVWKTTVLSTDGPWVEEVCLVSAATGETLLHYTLQPEARNRLIYDSNNTTANPGTLERSEGGAASGIADVDNAYDYLGWVYSFYFNQNGRDSIDNAGMTLKATARYCKAGYGCPYANAYWSGTYQQMFFGQGYTKDDITGHEMTHGVTSKESNLVYSYQSGAINESLSDMWGEWIDLSYHSTNDNDDAANRWLMGEDIGAIRDMSDPPAYGDPDKMSSPNWYAGSNDYGGVHTNSGVGNKLCYLLTDGDTFNGHTVYGMGIANVADLMYEAQIDLLTSGSDYADFYDALVQAAINIGWDAAEKANLEQACLAVEISSGTTPVDPYCLAGSNNTGVMYISRVQVGTIDKASGSSGYANYTATSTQMKIGTGYVITVTAGGTTYTSDQCRIWIDWNNDKDFVDAGETITMTGSPGTGPYTATITPPASAKLTNVRMRIRVMYTGTPSACGFATYGEVEDYTITVKGLCQASGGGWEYISGVEVGTINNTGTDASGYTDYSAMSATIGVGQSLPMVVTNGQPYSGDQCGIWVDWNHNDEFTDAGEKITVIGNPGLGPYSALITPPSGAALGLTRMRVRITYIGALEPCGIYSYGEVEDYRLFVMDYCDASASVSTYEHISRVQVGDIDNASDRSSYTDYTFLSTVMSLGQAYPAIVTNGSTSYPADQCGIWVDWNQDRDFTDAGEAVTIANSPSVGPYNGTITVPLYAKVGPTRMRVRITYTGEVSPCGTTTYGEVEDYTVVVQECPKPSNPNPADGALNVPIATQLSWNGGSGFVLDNFNRLNSTDMGANWSEQAGDFSISNNIATSTNSSLMTWQGAEPGQRLSVDVIQNGGSGTQYVAIVTGYADLNNCVFVKVQGSTQFTNIGFYYGNNGSNSAAWSNSGFISLTTPFTTARMTTILEGDTVTLLLDTNFDGVVDQTYTRNGLPTQLLGTGVGLGGYGSPLMDNFAVPPADYAAPFSVGDAAAVPEQPAADTTIDGSDTGVLPTEEQMTTVIRKHHAALHGAAYDENSLIDTPSANPEDAAGEQGQDSSPLKTGQIWRAGQEPKDAVWTASPDEIDITTGLPAQQNITGEIDYGFGLPAQKRVLWDLTHGVYSSYQPSGSYSTLVSLLAGQGYTVDTTSAGVENVNLLAYDILVVAVGSSWNSVYTAAEVAEIKTFVNNGGGLLVLGDNPGTPVANLNPVVAPFNMTTGVSDSTNTITNLSSHPIFTGCTTIAMASSGEVTVSLPSTKEALDPDSKCVVAVCGSAGKVVAVGDINFCTNTSIASSSNQTFILNVFNWLSEKLPSTGCMDLGHPTITPYYSSGISSGDRSIAVDVKSTVSVKSIGIMADIRTAATLNLTIRSVSGTTRGAVLATGSASVSPAGARLYSVPVEFTFQKGLRYDIAFDLTEGWGFGLHYMEFYSFNNATLDPASGFSAGPFTVLDGASSGGYGNTVMPHIRVCSDCRDLGHPTTTATTGTGIGTNDRTVAVEMNSDTTVTSLGVMASVAATGQMIVNIREITGTTAGVILATASRPVTVSALGFVDVPIEFTFRRGERYAIGFNMNGGWGTSGTQTMEWYSFHNPTLASANAFDVGPFKVLDGGTGTTFSNTLLPHIRACSIGLCPKKYDVYFGTVNPPATLLFSDLTEPTCNPGTLQYLTRYYWKVVVKGECCGVGEGPVWSFRTEPPCLPAANPYPTNGATKVSVHTNLYWSGTAGSGTLFAVRDGFDGFYTIDTITGVPTLIGPSGVTNSTCGLAHSGGDVLYGSKPFGLSVIHLDGSPAEPLGSQGMEGMAYNPSNGKIYASLNGAFFTINPATGAKIDTLANWPDDVEGLEYVSNVGTQGSIFGIDDDGQLHRYDIALTSFSIVGDTGLGASCDNSGLAYAGDIDTLFLITKSTGDLYKVNKNTAQTVFVANTGISGGSGFSGLAYGPAGSSGGAFAPMRAEEWQPSMAVEPQSEADTDGRPVPTAGQSSMDIPADNPLVSGGRAEFAAVGTTLTTVAIFQDVAPWTSTLNQDILAANGVAYTIFNSSQMGSVNIANFDKVIIPSAQESDTVYEFYTRLEANRAWLEDYVAAGGLLDLHMAAFGDEEGRQLPGGFVVTHLAADDVAIVDPAHAILNDPRPIGEAELDGWLYSVHGYISTVPAGAATILKVASTTRPVCMELNFGDGRIVITTQTVEWRNGSYNFLENMILYDLPATPSTTYDLYLGLFNPPALRASGLKKTSFDPTPFPGQVLHSCSTYYWKVVTHDDYCGTLTGPVWSFKTELLCDYDSSGRVNLADFRQFAMHWLETGCISPGWCSGADVDRLGGAVTPSDLILFANQWLKTCP